MSIRMSEARSMFGGSKDYQLATEAVAALKLHLDKEGREIAEQVLQKIDRENELRKERGLPVRRRIFADDIARVIKGDEGL